ncbi:MAG: hypothetical protein R3B69_00140 [Candidatus Paceibacterota bacterium]
MLKFFVIVAAAVAFGYYAYLNFDETFGEPEPLRACTLEAKLCPDGSAVGRIGPNCEFAACPGE